ncbi:type IV secretion system protein [uncultured Campylobacter sp.]|uniref:type IV secretion system protein n=1 Tax=uncultured Campylobacter sp. TaxID=218934 RepID=UPI002612B1B8|nr:type IV secretion system protein [uncultured Campylobacter sp.]
MRVSIGKMVSGFIASAALCANMFATGIPVVDGAANAQITNQTIQQAMEFAKEAKRWVDTTSHYKSELKAYADDIATKTGARDAINFINEVQDIYKNAKDLGTSIDSIGEDFSNVSKLDKQADKLFKKYFKTDPCGDIQDAVEKNLCVSQSRQVFKDTIAIESSSARISTYSDQLNRIAKQMKSTANSSDIKSSADYANSIALITAQIQAEKTQIELALANMNRQKEIISEKRFEANKKFFTGTK